MLCHAISLATRDEVYALIPDTVGSLGDEITRFHSLIDVVGFLEQDVREKFRKSLSHNEGKATKALKTLKEELCAKNPSPNYEKVVRSLGILNRCVYDLHVLRSSLFQASPPMPRGAEH